MAREKKTLAPLGDMIAACEAMINAITTETHALEAPGAAAAIVVRAVLLDAKALAAGERQLLSEWLDPIATSRSSRRCCVTRP